MPIHISQQIRNEKWINSDGSRFDDFKANLHISAHLKREAKTSMNT